MHQQSEIKTNTNNYNRSEKEVLIIRSITKKKQTKTNFTTKLTTFEKTKNKKKGEEEKFHTPDQYFLKYKYSIRHPHK